MRRLKINGLISIGILLYLISLSPNVFPQKNDAFNPIKAKIENLLMKREIPGVSVGVAKDGKIIWEEGFGFADMEKKIPADEKTIYSIGSTSKPITATAVMMLAEQGKINLDSPANTYLSKRAALRNSFGDPQKISVRSLLNHTSGLSRHSQIFIGDEIKQLPTVEETIHRYGVLTKPPGETFEYSNLGYGVLSNIVSQVSNQPFASFVRNRVFLPLNMQHSFYGKPKNFVSSIAVGYSANNEPVPDILQDTPGAADIYSTVHDLLLLGMFYIGENRPNQQMILKKSSILEMEKESADRGVSKYGLGLETVQIGKYKIIYHHGSNGYGTSIFMMLPEQRICISILSNITSPQTQELADDILKILIPDYEENLNEFRKNARNSSSNEEPQPYKADAQYLGHWKGKISTWKEEIPVEMWFQEDGDVQIQMKGQYRNLLNGVRFENSYLRGSFQGNIGTDDANRHPYNLHLRLKLRGNVLNGAITSSSTNPQGNVLTCWIELGKQK